MLIEQGWGAAGKVLLRGAMSGPCGQSNNIPSEAQFGGEFKGVYLMCRKKACVSG